MIVKENYSGYELEELAALAVRENNSKRKNLLVNYYQAKHIPADPTKALQLFERLAAQIKISESSEKTMVIGFAETATAIGAAVAGQIEGCTFIHTSRENIPHKYCVADFSEEHSHASEQYLFSKNGDEIFRGIKHIIFVEDELTTGKTILNLINILKDKTEKDCTFSAASIINGMNYQALNEFRKRNISVHKLISLDNSIEDMNRDLSIISEPDSIGEKLCGSLSRLTLSGAVDPRLGCCYDNYENQCGGIIREFFNSYGSELWDNITIDVIGTEECMYPAVILGAALQKRGCIVRSHSTTRSPIVPSHSDNYPLTSRYKLHSFYSSKRATYLYNLYPCDLTVLVTDAEDINSEAIADLRNAVKSEKLIIINRSE